MANAYLPLFTGDYKRDTEHLTTEEHGAYLLLLMALWDQGGRIKSDPKYLARIARVSLRRWPKFWAELKDFFYEEGGQIGHRRIDKETAKVHEISEKRSRAASKKWTKKSKKNSKPTDANAVHVECTQPKGLGSTLYRVENPTLREDPKPESLAAASAPPSPEWGGEAEAYAALKEIRHGATKRPSVSLSDMDQLKRAVRGMDGNAILLGPVSINTAAWAAIAEEASALSYELRFLEQPKLKLVGD